MHILVVLIGLWASSAAPATPRFSILQGATSAHVTHFTVLARDYEQLSFEIDDNNITQFERVAEPGSNWVVYRLHVDNLNPQTPYQLIVRNSVGEIADQRRFRTLDTAADQGKIAFGSCMVTQLHNPWMWQSIARENPDLILLLGDAVYLDRRSVFHAETPQTRLQVWQSFVESRNRLGLYFWEDLKPVISLWDDHDSGFNNDDATFALMKSVRHVFDTFMANEAIPGFLTRGPGLSKQFELYGRNFVILDGRSFRDLDPQFPLFGREQEDWLNDQVRPGQNMIFSGSQFYGGFIKKDSLESNWPSYSAHFTQRLRTTGAVRGANFVFGSGDIHFSEVQALEPELYGYPTFEITSSSIHSFAFPGHYVLKPDNPRRVAVTGTHNAVMLEMNRTRAEFTVRSVGWRGNDLFQMQIDVQPVGCESLLTANGG